MNQNQTKVTSGTTVISKKCTKCKTTKKLTEFNNTKQIKSGKKSVCKLCERAAAIAYKQTSAGKESVKKSRSKYYQANKDKVYKTNKEWYANNEEKMKEWYKEYWNENKQEVYAVHRDWVENNRDVVHLNQIKHRAKVKGREFELTEEWIRENREAGCVITGAEFTDDRSQCFFNTPSVDRIDSRRGYTLDNCRMILQCLNVLKELGDDYQLFKSLGFDSTDCPSQSDLLRAVEIRYNTNTPIEVT